MNDQESDQNDRIRIAETILRQFGGNQFRMMTGARNFIALESGLGFQLPNARQANGVKYVRVELAPSDTYTVTFFNGNSTIVGEPHTYIYCDQLREVFERVTGLLTSLGSLGREEQQATS